jgi:hypothetical protein
MANSKKMHSCREMFKIMGILPVYFQHIFPFLLYMLNKRHLFTKNTEVHNNDIRSANNCYLHFTNLSK